MNMGNFSLIISLVCPILARILLALAINLDCRARNLAQRKLFTVLMLFFPIIVGIAYAVRRKSLQKAFKVCSKCGSKADPYASKCPKCGGYMLLEYKNPKEKALRIVSIVLCVVGIIPYVAGEAVGMPSQLDKLKKQINSYVTGEEYDDDESDEDGLINLPFLCYDRNGVAYSDFYSIKYYDKDGKSYHWNEDDYSTIVDEQGNLYYYKNCYIDSEGYFFCPEKPSGEYYRIDSVYWNYDGSIERIE